MKGRRRIRIRRPDFLRGRAKEGCRSFEVAFCMKFGSLYRNENLVSCSGDGSLLE